MVLVVNNLDKLPLCLLKRLLTEFHEVLGVILILIAADLHNDDTHGQVDRTHKLIERILEVVDDARHQNYQQVVVAEVPDLAHGAILDLSEVADELERWAEVDWEG